MPDELDECAEVVTVDGEPALVHSDQPLDDAGRAAIEIVIRAAREKLAADRPTDEDVQRWAERIAGMPMSAARSWAGRLLNELVFERRRNAEPLGYITAYKADGQWNVSYDGQPFTWAEAIDDLREARSTVPEAEWHILEVRRVADA